MCAGCQTGRGRQNRRHHHIVKGVFLACSSLGQLAPLSLKRVARLSGCCPDKKTKAGACPVRFSVRHAAYIAQSHPSPDAKGLSAVGTVVRAVNCTKRLLGKAAQQRGASFITSISDNQLVGKWAVFWVIGIDSGVAVKNSTQSI